MMDRQSSREITIREVGTRDGIQSLGALLDTPVPYRAAPDLFCLDLYKEFDIGTLSQMAKQ